MHFYSDHPQYVLGFHGCEKSVRDKVLNSDRESLKVSDNDYDWLGSGIYFWLNDPIRALEWANRMDKTGKKILKEPAVIGAIIDLKTCLNLSEYECIQTLKLGYDLLNKIPKIKELAATLNINTALNKRLEIVLTERGIKECKNFFVR